MVHKVNQICYAFSMTSTNYEKHHCPIAQSLVELGDQWTLLIVRDAMSGLSRFNEFQDSLGISKNLLTRRLAQLCEDGIFERVAIPKSKRYAYVPTQKCWDLRVVLLAMAQWGEKWRDDPRLTRLEVKEKTSGQPLKLEFVPEGDSAIVAPEDIDVLRHYKSAG
jgi:DNA-binding HxlR family transcriptional regulator